MILTDQELRHMTISVLTQKTERDMQTRIGASDLSDQCDVCLGFKFAGMERTVPFIEGLWMGRTWGTAQHSILENKITEALTFDGLEGATLQLAREQAETILGLHPDARTEVHVFFCDIPGYGPVGGTIDADLPEQIIDWKSSTRKKICPLLDYMEIRAGRPARYGRTNTWVKLSEKEYAAEMLSMEYKVNGYFGQLNLYLRGAGKSHGSIVFLNRDGTGAFDNPGGARYEDPKAVHDVNVISFDYDEAYTDALIARGAAIWAHIETGGNPADFTSHPMCYTCGQLDKSAGTPATFTPPDVDVEATFRMVA